RQQVTLLRSPSTLLAKPQAHTCLRPLRLCLCVEQLLLSSVCRCAAGYLGEYCHHKDPCHPGYCKNGGNCSVLGVPGSPTCSCPLGYTGQHCQTPQNSTCYPTNPCVNQGVCTLLSLDKYKCQCAHGWTGVNCEREDSCMSAPCANGGTCSALSVGKFSCHCPPGYKGPLCLNDTDECSASVPVCQNGGLCVNTPGSYKCGCTPGFTGRTCETPYIPCSPSPCLNGGTCRQTSETNYWCHCLPGFNGTNCENNIDDCPDHKCQNGGTCMDGVNTYNCKCPPEWTGQFCTEDVDECRLQPNTCQNGGTCSNIHGSYTCVCVNGWSGLDCSENIDDCATAACTVGSTCIDRVASFLCVCPYGKTGLLCHVNDACISSPCRDGAQCDTNPINGMFNCNCAPGYKGSTCNDDINECIIGPNPCEHGGVCVNTDGSFTCNCARGYGGPRCETDVNECASSPCQNDGTCLDRIGDYSCICMEGFEGTHCEFDINECASSPCLNQGTCLDQVKRYFCPRPQGFSGEMCQIDIDECSSTPCLNGAKCIDRPNGYECECAEGTRVNCEINADDCAGNPCEYGTCQDGIDEYKCVCAPGYTGAKCDVDINECNSGPCMSGGTCVDKVNSFVCLCPPGTHGPLCHSGPDHCALQHCVHGDCVEQLSGYRCECQAGWVGQHCDQEQDECQSSPCQHSGTCVDRHNGYVCHCRPGFTGPNQGFIHTTFIYGPSCLNCEVNIDECASSPCGNHGSCVDEVNSFTCLCAPPYSGSNPIHTAELSGTLPGKHCLEELVPCASHPCEMGGVCQPTSDYTSYTCRCPNGWQDPCLNGGSCVDQVGGFFCDCRPGFQGERCEAEVDECASKPCWNGAVCRDYVNSFVCECQPGFDGMHCEHNIPECTERWVTKDFICAVIMLKCFKSCIYSSISVLVDMSVLLYWNVFRCIEVKSISILCLNNGTCVDDINTFSCRCRPGFNGTFCQYEQNECDSQPCKNGGTCTDETTWSCRCLDGWTGLYCDVPDMSCRDYAARKGIGVENVCKNSGRCVNVGKAHQCQCQLGYTGSYCEETVDECLSNPCQNGATCIDYQGTYECTCKAGFQGVNCEYDVNECHSNPCRHGGTCIDLINRFSCACPPGTQGVQCEVNLDDCAPKPGYREPHCLNGGQCVDGVGRFTCSCLPGFAGERCEGDINECLSVPCHSPGSLDCVQLANDYQCHCHLGYTGRHCESMVDLCQSKPCHNSGTCSMNTSSVHGYTCICQPGFTGFNCGELEGYNCAKLHCQNGGECQSQSGHLHCRCQPGFSGQHCEKVQSCQNQPCLNGGTCMPDPHYPFQYSCRCPTYFSGRHCESVNPTPSCPYAACEQQSGDKVCDQLCNNHECQWDGGDCSLHWRQPWANCTAPVPCWELFHNNRCDHECDNSGCLFDSFECQESTKSCTYEVYCADHYLNGKCDESCNTEACGWDGLDCSADTPSKVAEGTLVIVVLLVPEELLRDLRGFLRSLGKILHTNLNVRKDAQLKPMVYPYYGLEQNNDREGQSATMKHRGKRELDKEVIGSTVHLEIDNRECAQTSSDCISNTELALRVPCPTPLGPPVGPGRVKPPYLLYLAVGAAVIILLILVLGVLAAKRKRKHGSLWLPDGFLARKDDKRREPVGQDDFGMKNFKTQDGVMMDGSQRWMDEEATSKKPRTEDKPLLPLEVDGGVDRREWTLQHHKAADSSLTPPQPDLDEHCLDVNVKGPGRVKMIGGDEPGPNVISDLISQGATLMAQTDRTGETALHLAARYARADAAKRLLDAGADANAHDNMGRTPLHAAVAADAQGVFQILIRNRATELDARMNDGTTPLILAARLAVEGMVEELVHCHADINAVDDHGKSALHWAAAVNNVEATLVLLKNGANRDMQDNKEETPLFLAAREGSFEAAQVLLDHYSNRDITDHLDRLPRDTAQERMHHDIVRLLDQYNLVHSPHNGPNHMGGGGGHSSLVCGSNGAGYMGMRPGPQGKKRGPGGNGNKAAGGLPESSVTMSPVDSLESPHSYTGDVAGASNTANSPPLLGSPTSRPLLPPVSHMLGQQQSWVGLKPGYSNHMFGLLPQQMGNGHPGLSQHHSQSLLTPMNVTMSREQLPPIVTFQMMAPGGGQALLKQPQSGQSQGQNQVQAHSQQGPTHLQCTQGMMYQMPDMSLQHTLSHSVPHHHSMAHGQGMMQDAQSRQQLPPYQAMQSPVDKYPTPPSQHSYATAGSEGTTPGHPAHPPSEHPYLTPSPESPDPWSSSSPHSNSDWSDVTTSPTPLGNPHALPPSCRTHIPEQVPPQSQQTQQNPQQPQRGNMQVFA
uniref:Notch receptor 2 n=1 Tax=Esox lucius TaxID=8010 RepID=A0A6Q2X482_ESOLU